MVIAAAAVAMALSGLASASRAARAADERQQVLLEMRNIEARLRAGVPLSQVADRYPSWHIEIEAADRPVDPVTGSVLSLARLTRQGVPGAEAQFVYLEPGQLQAGRP